MESAENNNESAEKFIPTIFLYWEIEVPAHWKLDFLF